MQPRPGDVLIVDGRASVQFAGDRRLVLRVTSICPKPTYQGWAWITGYVLDTTGQATDRREVFVRLAGLRRVVRRTGPGGPATGTRPATPPGRPGSGRPGTTR